jgi:hypothetical protein
MTRTYTITISQEESDPELETSIMLLEAELEDLVEEFEVNTDADIEMEIS